ncbi:acyltransferase family protein [Andreprevotia lacus]|uniref:acyltransferase family protein n=1 Tax=Andreprevotia lacus TaxID=1121000 RepID=UPI00111C280D|nr:acyltransferase [Andreprevotia lacus]
MQRFPMRINNLDLFRGLAAWLVVLFHLHGDTGALLPGLSGFGWIGVDIFFVISGAAISSSAYRLYGKYQDQWKGIYWQHRIRRIYPLYILAALVSAWYFAGYRESGQWGEGAFQLLSHLLMLHGFFPWTWQGLLGPAWSLAIEFQFYLLMMLAWPWLSRQRAVVVMTIALLVSSLWLCYFWQVAVLESESLRYFYTSQLPGRLYEFAFGFLLFRIMLALEHRPAVMLYRARWLLMGIGAFLLIAWYCGAALNDVSRVGQVGAWLHQHGGELGTRIGITICIFMVLLGAGLCRESRLLKPLYWFGTISYGIYLSHTMVIQALFKAGLPALQVIFWSIPLIILIAAATYYGVERPFLRGRLKREVVSSGKVAGELALQGR